MSKTAAEFTMSAVGQSQFNWEYNKAGAFDWIVEGVSPELIRKEGVENYVREYVRTTTGAQSGNEFAASPTTLYKTWRSGNEFRAIVEFIKEWLDA